MFNKEKLKDYFNIKNMSFIVLVLLFIFIILLIIQNYRMTRMINYYNYIFDNQVLFDKKRQDSFEEYYNKLLNSYRQDIENMRIRVIKEGNNYFNNDQFYGRMMRHNDYRRHFNNNHYNGYYDHDYDHNRYFYDDYNNNYYMDNKYDANSNKKNDTYIANNRYNNIKNRNFIYRSKTNINEKEFIVKVSLPKTFTLDNVKVDFNNNTLIVRAEQQNKATKDNTKSYFYNSFVERYLIPETKATVKDIKITLDKNNELSVVVPIIVDKQNNK